MSARGRILAATAALALLAAASVPCDLGASAAGALEADRLALRATAGAAPVLAPPCPCGCHEPAPAATSRVAPTLPRSRSALPTERPPVPEIASLALPRVPPLDPPEPVPLGA